MSRFRCPQPWIFSFSTAVTLKIRSRSPKSKFFVMSKSYIYENLVRIQLLVYKIHVLCRQESVRPTPTGSAPKSICPPPGRLGDISKMFVAVVITTLISILWVNLNGYTSKRDHSDLNICFPSLLKEGYRIYPKYSDTSTPYHTCSKIWKSTIYYQIFSLKIAEWVANSVDLDETA